MNIVILAAGQGKRMHSDRPKVLHELAGRPLLRHVIDTARTLDPARICIVHGHGGAAVRAQINDADLLWAEQSPQRGTGHAVQQALPLLDADAITLVLYGDVPLIGAVTLRRLLAQAQGHAALALLSVELDDPSGYGRIVREGGAVRRIVEHRDADAAQRAIREVNTGILAAPTRLLAQWLAALRDDNAQHEYYLTDVVALAVAQGVAVETQQPQATWEVLGVNDKAQLAALERICQRNIAEALLAAGVTLADPARLDVRGTLACGRDVSIDVGCVFEGAVTLGDDVYVGPYSVVRDAHIAAGARIEAHCHLDGAQVGAHSRIGPYARLRPGAQLDEAVHIGNFCEVKASHIGAGSKANHLSYIGDSEVGRNVNVGAGAITCNYDGAAKHRTVIEDDVFIGSDSQLVAPVRVRRGATLGAGTTLTREAPADQLTLSRTKQVSVPGWKRPVKAKK